ncbi:hypothetical protein FZC79_02590 [Rossellomorea vietnamensis]|uniref:DUF4129 domain-containing protein n=1 Tax=Rossellomorea vietnamensis TaxID=218284 RepID=A0A5D4KKE7_9BACI|nr:hypothetical protein [Rossellomorea vietnamensis]TYR77722.1 hypothetical protein FZC79_02590 [Rossellomorea vietnamensis]
MEAAQQEIRVKEKSAYVTRVSVKLLADTLLLLAVLTFFTTQSSFLGRALPFLSLAIVITLPLVWAGIESSRKFNGIFLGIGVTLFLTAQFFLGLPWWSSLLLLFLLHWRISTHLEEERDSRYEVSGGYMLSFLIITLSSYVFQNIYDRQSPAIILFLFMSGMILYSGGTYIVRFAESAVHSKKAARFKSAKLPLLFTVLLAGLAALLAAVNDTVYGSINYVMGGVFWLLSFLVTPVWQLINWFLGLLPKDISEGLQSIGRPDMPYDITSEQLEDSSSRLFLSWWNEVLIAVLVLIILVYAWKRYKDKGWVAEEGPKRFAGFSSFKASGIAEKAIQSTNTKYSAADSEIRKDIFSLEKLAEKNRVSRLNGETLEEWLCRLGVQEDKEFYRLYEEVRYGNKDIAIDKTAWFKQSVKQVEAKITGKKP